MNGFRIPGAWIDEVHALDVSAVEWTPFQTITVDGYFGVFPLWYRESLQEVFPGKVQMHRAPTQADYARFEREINEAGR